MIGGMPKPTSAGRRSGPVRRRQNRSYTSDHTHAHRYATQWAKDERRAISIITATDSGWKILLHMLADNVRHPDRSTSDTSHSCANADRECIRVQRHHAQFVWREVVFQVPLTVCEPVICFGLVKQIHQPATDARLYVQGQTSRYGIAYGLQTTILVKGIDTDATNSSSPLTRSM